MIVVSLNSTFKNLKLSRPGCVGSRWKSDAALATVISSRQFDLYHCAYGDYLGGLFRPESQETDPVVPLCFRRGSERRVNDAINSTV